MTVQRCAFEWAHTSPDYGRLGLAAKTIIVGLLDANSPKWMWLVIIGWWFALVFNSLQKRV